MITETGWRVVIDAPPGETPFYRVSRFGMHVAGSKLRPGEIHKIEEVQKIMGEEFARLTEEEDGS